MNRDVFLKDLLSSPDDRSRRLVEMRLALEPSLDPADYPTYTCCECARAYRGPICGHCGTLNYRPSPGLLAWPARDPEK